MTSEKTVEKMRIGVDVIGSMKTLRKTFTDPHAFVVEILQNAQRAGASSVDIALSEKRREIRITNDGEVCEDLSKVFTACTSGWSRDVKAKQDPFGTGFFACMVVAGEVEIRSGSRCATWDVAKMFAEETLDVVTVEPCEHVAGFAVTLRKLAETVDFDAVRAAARRTAEYLPQDVTISGKQVKRSAPTDKADDEKGRRFCATVNTPDFQGVIYPSPFGTVRTLYQRRDVEGVYAGCVSGRLFIADGYLSPRAPDRTAWIRDGKWRAFEEKLADLGRQLLRRVLKTGTNREIDTFAEHISSKLTAEEIDAHLRFDLSLDDRVLIARLKGMTDEDVAGKSVDQLRWDTRTKLREGALADEVIAVAPSAQMLPSEAELLTAPVEARSCVLVDAGEAATASLSSPTGEASATFAPVPALADVCTGTGAVPVATVRTASTKTIREAFEEQRENDKGGKRIASLKRSKLVVWARADEMVKLRKQLGTALDHGLEVVIARHKLHEESIKRLPNAVHVLDLRESTAHDGTITNKTPANAQETRALHLLRLIEEKVYGSVEGRFAICDATMNRQKLLGGQVIESTPSDPIAFVWKERVYFVRKHLILADLVDVTTNGLVMGDRVFLARVATTIAHEVAHLQGLADKTMEHAERTVELTDTVLGLVFPLKK